MSSAHKSNELIPTKDVVLIYTLNISTYVCSNLKIPLLLEWRFLTKDYSQEYSAIGPLNCPLTSQNNRQSMHLMYSIGDSGMITCKSEFGVFFLKYLIIFSQCTIFA